MATTKFYAQQTDATDEKRRQNSTTCENRFPLHELKFDIKIELQRDVSGRGAPRRPRGRRGRRAAGMEYLCFSGPFE